MDPPVVSEAELELLQALYAELDATAARYLATAPDSCCPSDCARCCGRAAPLVSDVEAAWLEREVATLPEASRAAVRLRARQLRAELEAGAGDDFACPLLEAGRCLVYPARPYLCRSFGHSSRRDELGRLRAFSCEVLQPQVRRRPPPEQAFRISALRERFGRVVDSYLPIWLSTTPAQRIARWPQSDRAVVVAGEQYRVERERDQSP